MQVFSVPSIASLSSLQKHHHQNFPYCAAKMPFGFSYILLHFSGLFRAIIGGNGLSRYHTDFHEIKVSI